MILPKAQEQNENIGASLAEALTKVEFIMEELLLSYLEGPNREIVDYQISAGGKKVRPMLAIIANQMLGGSMEDVLFPAASLEILHNYTLLIDDIIDNSQLRRNKLTAWKRFGTSVSLCMGISFSASIFQGVIKSKHSVPLTNLMARTLKTLVEGEILDILYEKVGRQDEPFVEQYRFSEIALEDYYRMVAKKTAVLLEASCETGAICAGANEKQLKLLRTFGYNLGLAFQIQDDILDIFGSEESFGKRVGKDIEERKIGNIIILLALEEFSQAEKDKVLAVFEQDEIQREDVEHVITAIRGTRAREKAFNIAVKKIQEAKKALHFLPDNEWRNRLMEMTDFVVKRDR